MRSPRWASSPISKSISKGVIDIRDLIYFALLIGWFLLATAVVLDVRKAND